MLLLPNNCRCSKFSVIPADWQKQTRIKGPWQLTYRFYDPTQPKPKQVKICSMNAYETVSERKQAVKLLMGILHEHLKAGYNPFHKTVIMAREAGGLADTSTPFIDALRVANGRMTISQDTKKDIARMINVLEKACLYHGYQVIPIGYIKRAHIKAILDTCRQIQKRFSDTTYNAYKKYLSMLYNELLEMDAVESNLMRDIKKKPVVRKVREVLDDEERRKVDRLLLDKYPTFHRFLHIFFHSGARIRELMRVQVKDVDIERQTFRMVILKGQFRREVDRPIKNIAVPLWKAAIEGANPEHYVFSEGLVPGPESIAAIQISRRWREHVKKKHGIKADFYALKHLHTTEVVDQLDEKAAAEVNQHTTTGLVREIYDVKSKARRQEKIRRLDVTFVPKAKEGS